VIDLELPEGAYLGWRYVDRRRSIDRRQLYYDDGRVEAIEGDRRWQLCRFSEDEVGAAKAAIVDSGLPEAVDAPVVTASDTAPVVYAWRLDEREGRVANMSYPAADHPALERLDALLAEIEEAAGCWPLLADDG